MTLAKLLIQLDGSGYGTYKRISGTHRVTENIELTVDRVQSDPFAPPSLIQVRVPLAATGIKPALLADVEIGRASCRERVKAWVDPGRFTRRAQQPGGRGC